MTKAKTTTYLAKTTIFRPNQPKVLKGDTIELTDAEARPLAKAQAIGLWIGEDDEADETPLPKPRKKKREGKPDAPVSLPDDKTVIPDPKAK